jgi:DNA-binding PadR family transcriptional regulator
MSSQTYQASALGHALLGLLAREPLSGYDLARHLERPLGQFWSASHSQIYPELAKLESAGLVEHEVVPQDDRPDKKVFRPTDAGLAALVAWVTSDLQPEKRRIELLLRTHSVWLADPAEAAAMYTRQAERAEADVARYEEVLQRFLARGAPDPRNPVFGSVSNLRYGIATQSAVASWCRSMAKQLMI